MAVWGMWFVFGMTLLFAIVIVVVIWQLFVTRRAHAVLARDEAYRKLAEQTAESHQATAAGIEDLRQRIERIEKLLSEVE
jgi:hypothetical protein